MTGALTGKVILNTRAVHQADELNTLLQQQGAVPLNYPCIAIIAPKDTTLLDAALLDLVNGCFGWLVLTSTNTVMVIKERLQALGILIDKQTFRAAAVGSATADAARLQLGIEVFDLPPEYIAESLAGHLPLDKGARVLLPESAIARPTLANGLAARGAVVHIVDAYETVCGEGGIDAPQLLAQGRIDALTFTSSSTVSFFLERLIHEDGRMEDALKVCAVCIGPKTAATAYERGFSMINVAEEHTLDGLIGTLNRCFAR